ncbi:MAG: hypothetical protein ACYCX4_00815 [Bacillota bacterium]
MEIRENLIIPLGYGKFARSDKIVALEPIEEDRGPGRRTKVFVEQINSPMIASRTENSIVANMVETPKEIVEATAALELLKDVLDDILQVGPMLRKSIREEAGIDLGNIQKRIQEILGHEIGEDIKHSLFS